MGERSVASDPDENHFARGGVDPQFPLSTGALGVFRGVEDLCVEGRVERLHHALPIVLAGGDVVELLLHLGGELEVHDGREVFLEEIRHDHADVGGEQLGPLRSGHLSVVLCANAAIGLQVEGLELPLLAFAVLLDNVAAFLDGADGGGVSGRAANLQLLELLYRERPR